MIEKKLNNGFIIYKKLKIVISVQLSLMKSQEAPITSNVRSNIGLDQTRQRKMQRIERLQWLSEKMVLRESL